MKRFYLIFNSIFFKLNVDIASGKTPIVLFFIYFTSLVLLSILLLFCRDLLDFTKTIFNLYHFSDDNLAGIALCSVTTLTVVVYCFLKSLIENLVLVLRLFKITVKTNLISKISLFISFITLTTFCIVGNSKIQTELYSRVDDVYKLQKIFRLVEENNIVANIYANKIPTLYKKAGIQIKDKILSFEEIALYKNDNSIAIIDPNFEYKLLLTNGYKFYKVSNNAGLLVKSTQIINLLEHYGYKFSDYYFSKNFNLSKLGRVNRLKLIPNKGLEIRKDKPLLHSNKLYLVKGKYRFKLNLNSSLKDLSSTKSIGTFRVTASDKQILLLEKSIDSILFKNGDITLSYDILVQNNYHNVEITIEPLTSVNLYLSSASYSKSL